MSSYQNIIGILLILSASLNIVLFRTFQRLVSDFVHLSIPLITCIAFLFVSLTIMVYIGFKIYQDQSPDSAKLLAQQRIRGRQFHRITLMIPKRCINHCQVRLEVIDQDSKAALFVDDIKWEPPIQAAAKIIPGPKDFSIPFFKRVIIK